MKRDYPELEGAVKYIDGNGTTDGIVIGCNYDIGVTIIDANNKDHYLLCGNGPFSPQQKNNSCFNEIKYRTKFNIVIEMIKNGIIDGSKITCDKRASIETCSYAQ